MVYELSFKEFKWLSFRWIIKMPKLKSLVVLSPELFLGKPFCAVCKTRYVDRQGNLSNESTQWYFFEAYTDWDKMALDISEFERVMSFEITDRWQREWILCFIGLTKISRWIRRFFKCVS